MDVNAMGVRTKNVWAAAESRSWPTPYKKDKALYSPTSASEMKRINVERGAEESFLTDNDKLI
jgi:hypothetical protein